MLDQAPKSLDASVKRVLIVDDELTIRTAMRRFFIRLGWSVTEASNGEVALSLLNDDASRDGNPKFDIILSDLRMPVLTGIEMYYRLQREQPSLLRRLIFSTGDLVSDDAAAFVRSTGCVVLQKPFELAALRTKVEQLLAGAGD